MRADCPCLEIQSVILDVDAEAEMSRDVTYVDD